MNAKFLDLKVEKQDRIINAALKIFAINGYDHASTDDIVKEAQISKGLLFHYFDSKIGVYSFICDYCVKCFKLELDTSVNPSEKDYFKVLEMIEYAFMGTLERYPYFTYFVDTCNKETNEEALSHMEEYKSLYEYSINAVLSRPDSTIVDSNPNSEMIFNMYKCTVNAMVQKNLREGTFSPKGQYEENLSYLRQIRKLFD